MERIEGRGNLIRIMSEIVDDGDAICGPYQLKPPPQTCKTT